MIDEITKVRSTDVIVDIIKESNPIVFVEQSDNRLGEFAMQFNSIEARKMFMEKAGPVIDTWLRREYALGKKQGLIIGLVIAGAVGSTWYAIRQFNKLKQRKEIEENI